MRTRSIRLRAFGAIALWVLLSFLPACDGATGAAHEDAGATPELDVLVPHDLPGDSVGDAVEEIVSPRDVVAETRDLPAVPDVAPDVAPDVRVDAAPDAAMDTEEVPPEGPFGRIEGPCRLLLGELDNPTPGVWINTYVFDGDPFDAADLDEDAREIFDVPNAGGSSRCSEVFSMEVMDDCLDASLHATETEVRYRGEGSITDYVILVQDTRVGVSVTRAYLGPYVTEYTTENARGLLEDKLAGVNESTANVAPEDAWERQILHVWTLHADWAETVAAAWQDVAPALQADTIVLITVETGSDFVVTDTCDDDPTQ